VLPTPTRRRNMSSTPSVSVRCTACGALWMSPAGRVVVAKGKRCLNCEGELVAADDQVEANVGAVRQAWDKWLTRDIDGLVDQHHPEAEVRWLRCQVFENAEPVYRGHTGIRRCLEDCLDACEAFPYELRGVGDRVLTLGDLLVKDGAEETLSVAWIFRVREGKILSLHGYLNPAEALRDLEPA
jgi:ketosteroid isomerase-like protein